MIEKPPICGCGAGFCRSDAVAIGGRKFYVCPIKKGQGACSFFLWQDACSSVASSGLKSLTDFINISPSYSSPVEENQKNDSGQGNTSYSSVADEHVLLSPILSTNATDPSPDRSDDVPESQPNKFGQENTFESQGSNNLLLKSTLLKRTNIRLGELRECEEKFDEPLTRQSKRLRQGDFDSDVSLPGSSTLLKDIVPLEKPRNSFSSSSKEPATDFMSEKTTSLTVTAYDNLVSSCQSSASLLIDFKIFRRSSWMFTDRGETLRNQVQGWWGRLAFPPPKCLTEPAQKPYFCCNFPSFNPIFVPPNVCQLKEATDPPAELVTSRGSIRMKMLASKALSKASSQLQADLLGILRPLEIKDHEIMTQEANTAFDALDRLGTDHFKFREQVKEFIQNASLLPKIDQSISSNRLCEKLSDHLSRKNLKLTEIKDAQARFTSTLSVSTQRATRLTEEISRLKDKLRQAEAELSCCSSENAALKLHLSQISKDRVKSEHSVKKTQDRLKDAWRLRKVMEAEKEAAKSAFDKVKTLLWGSDNTDGLSLQC